MNRFILGKLREPRIWARIARAAAEFGVANGAGLLNMCEIAARVTRETGVGFRIVGFDAGTGLPQPIDYRDHPERVRRMYFLHMFEHPFRARGLLVKGSSVLSNPYLR
jgi:hypothetical protein